MTDATEEVFVVWDEPKLAPESVIEYLDDAVKAVLPEGARLESIRPHGKSWFNHTSRLDMILSTGERASYFLKVLTTQDGGPDCLHAEFRAMTTFYETMGDLVPKPVGVGTYTSSAYAPGSMHFFICNFVEMKSLDTVPPMDVLVKGVARLHKTVVSPNGMFGNIQGCYTGPAPQMMKWTSSWEECFSIHLAHIFDREEVTQGNVDEIRELRRGIFEKVIPRLLRPLQNGGRSIQPRLIHGDLWERNFAEKAGMPEGCLPEDRLIIYDASPWYAHNEAELAPWWTERMLNREYIDAYFAEFPPSEPVEDYEDRGMLYMIRFEMLSSSVLPGNPRFRNLSMQAMRYLNAKYAGGYEAWQAQEVFKGTNPRIFEKRLNKDKAMEDPRRDSGVAV